ncbi:hypothetical protein GCM10007977_000480 [Dactylosporangium sucinum]|uniref:Uncharacterized protein n=1 Tax=Dactylosporangium sucinum TaxID=1424081 RepID=A0A917SXV6_9ACTN|nr:hypothetical protein GCM10007977_000480 [Dactylosporangium sucinum]
MDTVTDVAQPLGVVLDPVRGGAEPAFSGYLTEILAHVGLPYEVVPAPDPRFALLVVTAAGDLDADALHPWLSHGGRLLLLGDPGPLAELAAVRVTAPVTEGRVVFGPAPAWGTPPDVPLRAFGGVRMAPAAAASVVARWDDGSAAVTVRRVGAGTVMVIGADLCQSVVRIQQGWPVHGDGAPPSDNTSPVDDGVLKVDDGIALSYEQDRALPPGEVLEPGFAHAWPPEAVAPYFHRPHADLWRHVLLRTLWWLAPALPWLGYWPAGVPAVGHLSHDTDGNADPDAAVALETFARSGAAATWCLLPPAPGGGPALSPETTARIAAEGHELGLHFDAHSPGRGFTEAELAAQLAWARAADGPVTTNKNHYLRWEGWDDFYRWCSAMGILVDGSRGPGTQGNVGFPFGTCHVAYPLGALPVLMLPLHFQDLAWTIQPAIAEAVLGQVLAHHGVLHCLFHGANMRLSPETRRAVGAIVGLGRSLGLHWWTAARIGAWERARRGVTLRPGPGLLHIDAELPLQDAAILIPLGDAPVPTVTGAPLRRSVVQRHGIAHLEIALTLLPGRTTLRLT